MIRVTFVLVAVLGAMLAAAAPAQAAPAADLSDCVHVDENGDIHISPSGCASRLDPVFAAIQEQCEWVTSNPAVPPIIACGFRSDE